MSYGVIHPNLLHQGHLMEEAAWPSSSTDSCPLCSTQFIPVRLPGRWWSCSDCSRAAVIRPLYDRRCSFRSLLISCAVTAHIKEWVIVHSAYHVSPYLLTLHTSLQCNLSAAVLLFQVCSWLQDHTIPLSHFGSGFRRGMYLTMSWRTGNMLRHWWVPRFLIINYVYLQKAWVRDSVSAYSWVIEIEFLSSPSVG